MTAEVRGGANDSVAVMENAAAIHHKSAPESAPGMIRTCDTGFRRAVLYPLSYGGGWDAMRIPG